MRVFSTHAAIDDVEAIYDYLHRFNPAAAERMAELLFVAANSLLDFPERGRPGRQSGTRELVAQRPYVLVYRLAADRIEVLRVWHAMRDR